LPAWDNWKKPWTKEQCRRRYVEGGDDIGIRELSVQSGRARSTVQRWSAEEVDGLNWFSQRVRFRSQLSTVTQQRTIEKTSERLSDKLSEIAIANYEAHRVSRDFARLVIESKMQLFVEALQPDLPIEQKIQIHKNNSGAEANHWHQILARSTSAIAEVTGLINYVQADSAAKVLISKGYEIVDPSAEEKTTD
jgi:hypothetical protein